MPYINSSRVTDQEISQKVNRIRGRLIDTLN